LGGLVGSLAHPSGRRVGLKGSETFCETWGERRGGVAGLDAHFSVIVGTKYGLSCVGCSAALMVAMVIIGMSSLGWIVVVSGMVLVYKLAPAPVCGRQCCSRRPWAHWGFSMACDVRAQFPQQMG
jgi:Predicted metal-binding integral membrane protein (DUF2182)